MIFMVPSRKKLKRNRNAIATHKMNKNRFNKLSDYQKFFESRGLKLSEEKAENLFDFVSNEAKRKKVTIDVILKELNYK